MAETTGALSVPARGEGNYVTAVDGTTYIDCLAAAGAWALGHNHPVVAEAIRGAVAQGIPLQGLDFPTPTKDEFDDELFAGLPPPFAAHARVQFCGPTGADGVEAAIKLVKTASGRATLLSFAGGYHGMRGRAKSVLRFLPPLMPPLIVSVEQLDTIVERFTAAVRAADRLRPTPAPAPAT